MQWFPDGRVGEKGKENREAEDKQQLSQKKKEEEEEKSWQDDARRACPKGTILSGTKILRLRRKMHKKYPHKPWWGKESREQL